MIGFLMLVQAVFLIKRHRFRGTKRYGTFGGINPP